MKNVAKKTYSFSKNFVSNHRVGIAVITTALVVGAGQRAAAKEWNQFLEEKGLTDEFYNPNNEKA